MKRKQIDILDTIKAQAVELAEKSEAERGRTMSQREKALTDLEEAGRLCEEAASLDDFEKALVMKSAASKALAEADEMLAFIDDRPRKWGEQYDQWVQMCKDEMSAALDEYTVAATSLMEQLREVKDKYRERAARIDETLCSIEDITGVTKSRYPYEVRHFVGLPDVLIEDPDAWRKYAVRYDPATAAQMAMKDGVLGAAWRAVLKAFPEPNRTPYMW